MLAILNGVLGNRHAARPILLAIPMTPDVAGEAPDLADLAAHPRANGNGSC